MSSIWFLKAKITATQLYQMVYIIMAATFLIMIHDPNLRSQKNGGVMDIPSQ